MYFRVSHLKQSMISENSKYVIENVERFIYTNLSIFPYADIFSAVWNYQNTADLKAISELDDKQKKLVRFTTDM